jgi:acetyl esterase/lipase
LIPPFSKENFMNNRIPPYFLDEKIRDLVLILPGGGYDFTSPREALPVANAFHEAGYHAAVFEYRLVKHPYPALLEEAEELIAAFRTDRRIRRVFLCGFSAGGHFAGLIVTAKPTWFAGAILAYPVITSDVMTRHDGSIRRLIGDDPTDAELASISIEKRIQKGNPPIFLWHTMDDRTVPVENALVLITAAKRAGVSIEAHLFQQGAHGLSLANRHTPWDTGDPLQYENENTAVAAWFGLCLAWLNNQ